MLRVTCLFSLSVLACLSGLDSTGEEGRDHTSVRGSGIRGGHQEPGSPRRSRRILVTNDDGIDSPRLHALAKAMAALGEVVVIAPDSNRSGASHSARSFSEPTHVTERRIEGAAVAQAVSGTPADAVNFGLFTHGLKRPFDVVVSGINRGHNAGLTAHYSGTVGAALEAVHYGIPGVAISAAKKQTDHALSARFAVVFVRRLLEHGAPRGVGYNINVPVSPAGGRELEVVVAPMAGAYYRTVRYRPMPRAGENAWFPVTATGPDGPVAGDLRQFCAGKVTITPLRIDWTDREMLEKLRRWKLRVR